MIDNYAMFAIFVRIIAEWIFILILVQQSGVLFNKGKTQYLQVVLLFALLMLTLGNGVTLGLNFYRGPDGNLQEVARHAGTLIGGLTTLGAAVALYLINKFKLK